MRAADCRGLSRNGVKEMFMCKKSQQNYIGRQGKKNAGGLKVG